MDFGLQYLLSLHKFGLTLSWPIFTHILLFVASLLESFIYVARAECS